MLKATRIAKKERAGRRHTRQYALLELQVLENRDLPTTTVGLATNFPGLDFSTAKQLSGAGFEPPDTNIAIGPSDVVETVNTALAIHRKSDGALISQMDLRAFFAPVGPSGDLFDPICTYDELSGRFVVAVIEEIDSPQQASFLNFAVSNSSDPTQGFGEMHRLDVLRHNAASQAVHADYPTIGRNGSAYVFTVNMYTFGTSSSKFDHVQVISVAKVSALDANPGTLTVFQVDRPAQVDFSLSAASMHNAPPGDPMWFVEEDQTGSSGLNVVRMTNVLSASPTFTYTDLAVPAYTQAVAPTQPGGKLFASDALDSRILNVAMRGNMLVADHTVANGADDRARWYQFDTGGSAPMLVQSGEVNRGPGVSTFIPAIDIAPDNSFGMIFEEASSSEPLSIYVSGRLTSDATGMMASPTLVQRGQQAYSGTAGGDFSGMAVDATDGAFWGGAEYTNQEPTNWGTWVARFTLSVTVPVFAPVTLSAVGGASGPTVIFTVTQDHALFRHDDATGWIRLGGSGTILSISAAEEASGNAVVFVITTDHALYRNDRTSGWVKLGDPGTVLSVAAGTDLGGRANAFVLTGTDAFYEYSVGAGWQKLGDADTVVAASPSSLGRVYVTTNDRSVFEHDDRAGWLGLAGAGFAEAISVAPDGAVYAATPDQALERFRPGSGWVKLGASGTIASVVAGSAGGGADEAFVLSTAGGFLEFSDSTGWAPIGAQGTILRAAAAEAGRVFVVTADHSVFGHADGSGWYRLTSGGFALS